MSQQIEEIEEEIEEDCDSHLWSDEDAADYAAERYEEEREYYGSFGPQYYQNPRGRCEDSPCCGCCGYH